MLRGFFIFVGIMFIRDAGAAGIFSADTADCLAVCGTGCANFGENAISCGVNWSWNYYCKAGYGGDPYGKAPDPAGCFDCAGGKMADNKIKCGSYTFCDEGYYGNGEAGFCHQCPGGPTGGGVATSVVGKNKSVTDCKVKFSSETTPPTEFKDSKGVFKISEGGVCSSTRFQYGDIGTIVGTWDIEPKIPSLGT